MAPLPLYSRSLDSGLSVTSLARRLSSLATVALQRRATPIALLVSRQQNANIVPTTYGSINSGPAPGTVVGIVLGSVGGFLLILWLIYTCLNLGTWSSASSYTESVVVRNRRKSHGSRGSRRVSETVEVRRERSPVRVVRDEPRIVREPVRQPERVERVVVEEERREVRREQSPGSDEVVVIEEHSPPRRSKSKRERRESRREEEDVDNSGFRTVDPLAYGGVVGGRKSSRR